MPHTGHALSTCPCWPLLVLSARLGRSLPLKIQSFLSLRVDVRTHLPSVSAKQEGPEGNHAQILLEATSLKAQLEDQKLFHQQGIRNVQRLESQLTQLLAKSGLVESQHQTRAQSLQNHSQFSSEPEQQSSCSSQPAPGRSREQHSEPQTKKRKQAAASSISSAGHVRPRTLDDIIRCGAQLGEILVGSTSTTLQG